MSQPDLQMLENYLLLPQEESMQKIIKGTDHYYYLTFLRHFNEKGYLLSEEQKKQLKDYTLFKTQLSQSITLKALFLEYDSLNDAPSPQSDLLRSEIIRKIAQQLFNLSFNHAQPTREEGSYKRCRLTKQVEIENCLKEQVFSLETFLKDAYTEKGFKKLHPILYINLDLTRLALCCKKVIKTFLHKVGFQIVDFEKVPEFYNILFKRKDYKHRFILNDFRILSLKQMEALFDLNENIIENQSFFEQLCQKKFRYNLKDCQHTGFQNRQEIQNYTEETDDRKLYIQDNLKKLFKWTQGLPPQFQSFKNIILFQLLEIGIAVNDFDFELLKLYLRDAVELHTIANEAHLQVLQEQNKEQWQEFGKFGNMKWLPYINLVEKYFVKYFEKFGEIKIFEQYLEATYLNKLKAQTMLYQGKELANIYEYLDTFQIESLINEKQIYICSYNKAQFKHGQPVKLQVELKNIPRLDIKIFQINSENYDIQNQLKLDNNIKLHGLMPFYETSFKYDEAPIVKFTKEFTFDNITDVERGIFIIEFIGNGITSRAIIKKGRLQLREKITAAGHAFQILDENFELCCSDRSGLWVDRKFYQIDKERKEVLIPFGQSTKTWKATIVHQNYAELVNITIQQEIYDLKCAFIIPNEEMLMGSQAKAIIYTKLFINQQESSLRLLKNPSVSIISVNDVDVTQTIFLDNLKFTDNEPLEVQFSITAKIKKVLIRVSAKIERMHNDGDKKEELLEQAHTIQFYNYEGTNTFCRQFLRFTQDEGYNIHLLGKNGEPKEGIQIKVNIRLRSIIDYVSQTLLTDKQGKVVLGKLVNVHSLNSTVNSIGDICADQQNWELIGNSIQYYPNKIKVLVNQQISIPFICESIPKQDIVLVKIFKEKNSFAVASLTDLVKLENNNLIFQLPQPGSYNLIIKKHNSQIEIKVLEGEFWKNTSLIKSNQSILIDNAYKQQINISDINSKQLDHSTLVSGKVVSQGKPKIIAIATQFIQQNMDDLLTQLQNFLQKDQFKKIKIKLHRSVYQNNIIISDEEMYVLNRKTQERYIGNTLEKPQILLKRQMIRENNIEKELSRQNSNYAQQSYPSNESLMGKKQLLRNSQLTKQIVDRYQDFLQHPGLLVTDIKLNDQKFAFTIPNGFATVFVIAFNDSNLATNQVGLKCENIATRNLCHQSALNKDKFYSIFRNSQLIKEGEKVQIQDLTSTEIKLVDSLDKMFILLKELRNINGSDSEQDQGFTHWEFLTKWHTFSIDQKHKKYDEFQCDEFNIFIYFRDPAYFETYIKSYVQNKIERSFIDSFLLLEHQVLQTMANVDRITELNALEQVLLVIYFAELLNKPEKAQEIALFLENQDKLIPIDYKKNKTLFKTVLGTKTKDEDSKQSDQEINSEINMTKKQINRYHRHNNTNNNNNNNNNRRPLYQSYECRDRMNSRGSSEDRATAPGAAYQLPLQVACHPQTLVTYSLPPQTVCKDNEEINSQEQECSLDQNYVQQEHYENKRQKLIENFKNIEKTKEFGELHYCKVSRPDQSRYLVPINGFWVDLANHSISRGVLKEDFLSQKFIYCNSNHTQMIAVLAFIGLPDEAPVQEYKQFQGKGVEITTQKSAILFTKEIKEGKAQLRSDILVAQRFFDPQDRFTYTEEDPDLQLEKDVEECLVNRIYGCQIIVTNCSSTRADYQVLIEVPNGAIPVNTVAYTKSYTIPLQPYSTQRLEYFFYFPNAGNYAVYPANVSRFGQVVCVAKDSSLKVVLQKSVANLEVLDDILAKGSKDDILKFLSTKNIFNPNIFRIQEILYLFKDKEFYLKVIEILRTKRFMDYEAWSYSVYHNDSTSLKEFFNLERSRNVLCSRFKYFKCSLFEISNIRFFEYYPLITKRIHKLTQEAKGILNVEFREQYMNFLMYLSQKGTHSVSEKLVFIYYLLLQERINEAIQVYKSIIDVPLDGDSILQYDYFTAYLDFYINYPNFIKARAICEKYMNYPVIHWRNAFYEIVNQLVEYDGEDDESQKLKVELTQRNKHLDLAKKEETLTSVIEGNNIIVTYSNLSSVTLQFYKIDLEVLFSRNPFFSKYSEGFLFVRPNFQIIEQLKVDQQAGVTYKQTIEIPEQFRSYNLFVQIKGLSKYTSNKYFSTSLNVQIMENNGQIRVADSNGKYLAKVYVKAYIKEKNGTESFYKDGYTDLRGRFDYASLSSAQLLDAEKFSIFIASDELGSVIKEVNAPTQVGQFDTEVKLLSKAWNQRAQQEHTIQQEKYRLYNISKENYTRKY